MSIEIPRLADKDLRTAVACLEMEISDSCMEDLLAAISNLLQKEDIDHASSQILLAMDSVAKHVDTLRVRSNPRAFILLNELWEAYDACIRGEKNEQERWFLASAEMKKVLDWQRQCFTDAVIERQSSETGDKDIPPSVAQLVQEKIAETGNLVQKEMAVLMQLAEERAQKGGIGRADLDQQISSTIAEQTGSLQQFFDKELCKLRKDLQLSSTIAEQAGSLQQLFDSELGKLRKDLQLNS